MELLFEPSLAQLLADVAEKPAIDLREEEGGLKRSASEIADDWFAEKMRAAEDAFDAEHATSTVKPNTETLDDYVDAEADAIEDVREYLYDAVSADAATRATNLSRARIEEAV